MAGYAIEHSASFYQHQQRRSGICPDCGEKITTRMAPDRRRRAPARGLHALLAPAPGGSDGGDVRSGQWTPVQRWRYLTRARAGELWRMVAVVAGVLLLAAAGLEVCR